MSDWGKTPVTFVEIDQPFCTREWGDAFFSPTGQCNAVLGSSDVRKCYQTMFTCPVPTKYNPATLTLRFARQDQVGLRAYGYCLPYIKSIRTAPQQINLGGMDDESNPLGTRESVTITMVDSLHSDLLVDKYRLERITGAASSASPADAYNPYTRGTFWGKWIKRNPYYSNYKLRIREGYLGDDISTFRVRTYLIYSIKADDNGSVSIVAKDIFTQLEDDKAVAPKASQGELHAAITSASASFTLDPAGIGSTYLAAGYVCIGDEAIQYTRSGDTFTAVARGALNTVAASHNAEDLVQQVLTYTSMRVQDIVFDLLCAYTALGNAGSPTGSPYIDKTIWDDAASNASFNLLYTAKIAKPTPVKTLIAELAEQVGFSLWPRLTDEKIQFKPYRANASALTVNDQEHLIEGSFKKEIKNDKRVSQVWVYYGQRDPTKAIDEETNFFSRFVDPDLVAEDTNHYGTAKIRKVFSRWIPQNGRTAATRVSDRLSSEFVDPPTTTEFVVHSRYASSLELADFLTMNTKYLPDVTGADGVYQHAIISMERSEDSLRLATQSIVAANIDTTQTVILENNQNNVNLRTIYDGLFGAPVGGSPGGTVVVFIVDAGVTIGSTSTGSYAMRTGSWPSGVSISLRNNGRIQGKGGRGGDGGSGSADAGFFAANSASGGTNGEAGGPALLVEFHITIDNASGQIWSGGGGGGGGGGAAAGTELHDSEGAFFNTVEAAAGGSSGAGGSGTDAGVAGTAGGASAVAFNLFSTTGGSSGGDGNANSGGPGAGGNNATAGSDGSASATGGSGGAGGGPGLAGANGGSGAASVSPPAGGSTANGFGPETATAGGGAGGAAGVSIQGIASVTFASPGPGDIRGPTA
jgi:hypothetical protein